MDIPKLEIADEVTLTVERGGLTLAHLISLVDLCIGRGMSKFSQVDLSPATSANLAAVDQIIVVGKYEPLTT